MSTIDGTTAKHEIVSDACRTNRGDVGAIDEALARLREEALRCLAGWPQGGGARFHFALTVERPTAPVKVKIRVNGKEIETEERELTFEKVVELAKAPKHASVTFFSKESEGMLRAGQTVQVVPGLTISAYDTSNA